ncbi:MAG TPA: hypothetical protein VER96_32995 [Polyangiaceae bacterium]|nr:hypothetical protein [Polyangiaceae bacterium]
MSSSLSFRSLVSVSALLAGCSQSAEPPYSGIPSAETWKVIAESADPTVSAGQASAASDGRTAAVAYIETDTARVVMQRFDAKGERIGSLVVLGSDPDLHSIVSLASDGKQYAACWNTAPEVHCSLVDEQGQVRLNALAISGQDATIVGTATGWAVAYAGDQKTVRLQALTSNLAADRKFIDLRLYAHFNTHDQGPLFASTPSGYALVARDAEDGEASLSRLDSDLMPTGSAIPLGHPLSYSGQLVATDTRAVVSLSAAYGSYLLLMDSQKLTGELAIGGGGKTGNDQALALTAGGIGAAWLDPEGTVQQRFLADGHDSDIGLDHRSNDLLALEEEATDSYQRLLLVDHQTLLLAKSQRYGTLTGTSALRVATLKFHE